MQICKSIVLVQNSSNFTLDFSFDNEQQQSTYNSSLDFTLQELVAFIDNSSIDQHCGETLMNVDSPDTFPFFTMGCGNTSIPSTTTLFADENEMPLDLMFTNIEDISREVED